MDNKKFMDNNNDNDGVPIIYIVLMFVLFVLGILLGTLSGANIGRLERVKLQASVVSHGYVHWETTPEGVATWVLNENKASSVEKANK